MEQLGSLTHRLTPTDVILGAIASRDWRPMHHDHAYARSEAGVTDIFMNTPTLQGWLEHYIVQEFGDEARIARLSLRITDQLYPGVVMRVSGVVVSRRRDESGGSWLDVEAEVSTDDVVRATASLRVCIPSQLGADPHPWKRSGPDWSP